jgi:hypothetical protein
MDIPTIESLKDAFSAATSWNERATAIVVFGVIIELAALLIFSKKMARSEKILLVSGSIMVVAGVAGEYIFGGRASAAARQLQQFSDRRVAELKLDEEADRKIATQAAAHAADLGVTVDNIRSFVTEKEAEAQKASVNAKKDAAEMTAALNLEREVRERFARMVEPRSLTASQADSMASRLAQYRGQQWTITTYWDLKEPLAFANMLYALLGKASWTYDNSGSKSVLLGGIAGVQVYVHPEASTKAHDAAAALVKALSESGFETNLRFMNDPGHPTERLALNIGTKN